MDKQSKVLLPWFVYGLIFALPLFMEVSQSHASGFGIFTQGADGLGQANATVAHSDGPSAAYFNPALLPSLTGTQVEIGTTAVLPSRKFKSDLDGSTERNEDTAYFPSTFYLTHQLNDRWGAGLAVFNPFGLGTVWDSAWEGNTIATKSRITTFNINPSMAFQVTPRLAIGAGLDILLLDAKLKNKISVIPNQPTIDQSFSGDGEGIGFNFGLQLQMTEALSLGVAYRSEVKIDVDGKARFDIPTELEGLGLGSVFPDTKGKTSLTLPAQFTAALAYRISPAWVIEVGARWEEWSSFKQLKIDLAQPVAGQDSSVYPRDWSNTWAFNLGTKYQINDRVALMAGYLYGDNPIPDDTFEPAIPDSDTHLFTVGSELTFDNFKIALAYGFQRQQHRDKETNQYTALDGSVANGTYENHIHLAAVSLRYAF